MLAQARLYIACMKNRELELQHYPTTAELYAFERAARAARAAELARLGAAFVKRIRSLFAEQDVKGVEHA